MKNGGNKTGIKWLYIQVYIEQYVVLKWSKLVVFI
jgi:hypothetical protein